MMKSATNVIQGMREKFTFSLAKIIKMRRYSGNVKHIKVVF